MKPIIAPITSSSSLEIIANLQVALFAIGYTINRNETDSQKAGPDTIKAVRDFQSKNNIPPNDVILVDETTAALINRILKDKNLLDNSSSYTVSGKVLNAFGEVLEGQKLVAFDVDLRGAKIYKTAQTLTEIQANKGMQQLGEAVSQIGGSYSISFTSETFNMAELGLADVIIFAVKDDKITGRSLLSTITDYSNGDLLLNWDVTISGTSDRGISEFAKLFQEVNNMLRISDVPMTDLFDSPDQIAFLASEIQENSDKVKLFIKATELAQSFPNNPEAHALLYALGRQKITLSFSAIALTQEEKLIESWQLAENSNIIEAVSDDTLKRFLLLLHNTASIQILKAPETEEAISLVKTLNLTSTDVNVQTAFINASRSFTGTAEEFWTSCLPSLPEFSAQPGLIKSLQLTNQLVALTANHIPLVEALQNIKKIQTPTDLLSFSDNDWDGLLKTSGIPNDIAGSTDEEKLNNYKDFIQAVLNAAYPTQKIASMIAGNKLEFKNTAIKEGLASFFTLAPNFDIETSRISDFEEQLNHSSVDSKLEVKQHLAKLQRLYSVSPTTGAFSGLVNAGFHSANQIANVPQQAFIDSYSETLGGMDIALTIHQRATFQTMRIEKLVSALNDMTNKINPQTIVPPDQVKGITNIIQKTIPNWTELFGAPDFCDCEECRSVYGASAYLVDILQFLGKLKPDFDNHTPLYILSQRRPDIAFLPLTCENTNTLIPYIDLVNEIMEYYVAHGSLDANAAYDTGSTTADELRANPQNTIKEAYRKLKNAVYPFSLPYHQPLDVERIYYKQMRTSRSEVMTLLQKDFSALTNKSINAETLKLSQEEYSVMTGGMDFAGNTTITNTRDYFGTYTDDTDFLSKIYKVPEFLQHTGLNYKDVVNLLLTHFINPGQPVLDYIEELFASGTITSSDIYQKLKAISGGADPSADSDIMAALTPKSIVPGEFKTWVQTNFPVFQQIITLYQSTYDCDLGSTELRTLQSVYENLPDSGISITDVFPKIHRFIRLWNKLQWDMFDLDIIITSLGEKNITDTLIDKLALVSKITANVNVPLNKLANLWGNIQVSGNAALYKKLFLNRTIQKIDTAFQADKWGAYLSDTTALLKDHLTAIQAAYRVSGEDLNLIFNDAGLLLSSSKLTLENLSIIYRYIVLSKALQISIADLLTVKNLFKINPFSNFDSVQEVFIDILPQTTLDFCTLVSNIKASGFKIATLNYIIGDIANPQFKLDMPEETVQNAMLTIRKGFLQIENDHPDSDLLNNITEVFLRSKMQLIYQSDIVNNLINILNGSAIFSTVTDKNIPVTIPAPQSNYITYIKGSVRFQCVGVLNDNDKKLLNLLSGATPDFKKAVKEIYEQPEQFLKDNFSALFTINMNDALANLLDHPAQITAFTEQDKLNWFYKNFLPYLKSALRQNILIQSMATVIGLDEPSTQVLLQSQTDILIPLLSQTGLIATYFKDETFTTAGLVRTDKQVDFSWDVNAPDPAIPFDHFSVRWEGYLNPPSSGEYTLKVKVAEIDDAFNLFVDDQLLLQKNSGDPLLEWEDVITLSMSRSYKLTLEYAEQTNLSGIQLYWKTDTTPKKVIDTINLYPLNVYKDLAVWLKKFQKAALFITGFNLKVAEISHFIKFNANFNAIDFNNISKDHWQRIYNYTSLNKSVQASSTTFIDLFELANRNSPAPTLDDVLNKIGSVTSWNISTFSSLVKNHFNFQVIDFKNEIALLTILKAIKLIQKTGVAADAVALWSAPETDFDKLYDQSEEIKKAVKAKYEDEDWLGVAKNLSNKLREDQKQALISYLLVQPELIHWGVIDADSLYEYFLIDVQMGACMDTSRIVQATAAVQLFITRCILNLESKPDGSGNETGVQPNQIDQSSAIRWQWMQYYRVWEANRKVFLYPENWLDPELRDDKSPFFKELESELLQNDITRDSVDTAFYNYLNKLDEVSHLDICGMYEEDDANGKMMTLHVFGRTHGKSHALYYRTCNQYWHWSAWEKVSVDVKGVDGSVNSNKETQVASGVHLTPVVWKNRLFIFWPEFLKKQPNTASDKTFQTVSNGPVSDLKPDPYWEISLGWSEYKNGKWNPKNISSEFLIPSAKVKTYDLQAYYIYPPYSYVPDLKNYTVTPSIAGDEKLTLSLVYQRTTIHGQFILSDIHNPVQTQFVSDPNFFKGLGGGDSEPSVYPGYTSFFMQIENSSTLSVNYLRLKGNKYLQSAPNHKIIFSPQNTDFEETLSYPFFYRDDFRSYFIRTTNISYLRFKDVVKAPMKSRYIPVQLTQMAQSPKSIPHLGDPGPVEQIITNTLLLNKTVPANIAPQNTMSLNLSNETITDVRKNSAIASAFAGNKSGYSIVNPYIFDMGLTFYTNYHPYSQAFIKALNTNDIDGLMQCDITLPDDGGSLFEKTYLPNHTNGLVQIPSDLDKFTYYKENVAFDEYALYGLYNWELFYHVPLYIATRLSKNGKYQEAMKWFHYIFDPTTNDISPDPTFPESRYWKVLPFKTTPRDSLIDYFKSLQPGKDDPDIEEWKDNPFKPFLVARNRPIAFMKNVVMKYIDNLIAWGDDLFRTDTRENINTATQLYIIAAHILGPKPQAIPSRGKIKAETYNSLQPKLDDFSNAMVDLENLFPYSSEIPVSKNPFPGSMLGVGSTLYFCIPDNDKLLQYWDTVGDRLFKIRHCMNIEGVERSLALFAPPIDPGLLIRATASGLSIGSILADLNSPGPLYRFNYLVQKATEFCSEVKALGNALQSAIEKKESEDLARIRAGHETTLLNMITQVKERQILEAKANKQNLEKNRQGTVDRIQYYLDYLGITDYTIPAEPEALSDDIDQDYALPDTLLTNVSLPLDLSLSDTDVSGVKIIPKEKEQLDRNADALNSQLDAIQSEIMSGFYALIPELGGHVTPFGVGAAITFGGKALSWMASSDAKSKGGDSATYTHEALRASTMASYIRRDQESSFQLNQALKSLGPLDKQLLAADIRIQIAEKELSNHRQQISNAQEIEDYLQNQLNGHSKFTSMEFYVWMKEQLFSVYKQSYQMAFDLARRAEKAYQFELGNPNTSFIQYGYFDSAFQGLTAGEQLHFSIKQMEKSFMEQNKREFELTKHISLALTRPDLLLQLKQNGSCEWMWPEELFDLDYPGHYFRRIKSISISIPCVAGPYTTINATLRLLNNSIRVNTASGDNGYEHNNDSATLTDDSRFTETKTPFVAIATSSAQNDSGMFELNFRDERYLPFEGAGVISKWKLELNGKYLQDDNSVLDISQYDFNSVSDIIVHIHYTSREDAGQFRQDALSHLQDYFANIAESINAPLMQFFNAKQDLPNEWYQFMYPVKNTDDQVFTLNLDINRFPFFVQKKGIKITSVELILDSGLASVNGILLVSPEPTTDTINLVAGGKFGDLLHGSKDYTGSEKTPGAWIIKNPAANARLNENNVSNFVIIVHYEIL
jgi:hypothetical protein